MVGKKSKWAAHLKAAESSGLSLAAYATKHKFDVRRLYDAFRAPQNGVSCASRNKPQLKSAPGCSNARRQAPLPCKPDWATASY